ncbi:hypothetical protein IFM89_008773 [Coptis chinensis]|uniref:Uncharacterized protein n=1 Tax=Coptis chinensis TaxID=261450 RepID=A0A835H082_9MAGN|nr:hypothetical protein IFM89_008773 [Coptis chinensis]
MQKPAKQGYKEKVPDEHRMRITLSCKNVKNLEKVCDDLMTGAKTGTLKVKGLVRIPTKVAKIVVEHGIQNTNNKIMAEELKMEWGLRNGELLRVWLIISAVILGAFNVCFEGAEDLPGGGGSKYGTSVKKEVAMDSLRDIILAYMQNGELLQPDHRFPVRMIIPGFIGGRMVKWLTRIIVTTEESQNYYHFKDNRVLPSHVDHELANSEVVQQNFNWKHRKFHRTAGVYMVSPKKEKPLHEFYGHSGEILEKPSLIFLIITAQSSFKVSSSNDSKTVVYVGREGEGVIGAITNIDTLRHDARYASRSSVVFNQNVNIVNVQYLKRQKKHDWVGVAAEKAPSVRT